MIDIRLCNYLTRNLRIENVKYEKQIQKNIDYGDI